ncbi:MAG: phosphatidylglycerophosphatase A [Candidatus Omnitrophota bacterium]
MISSGLYLGYLPKAPGTFGSLLGLLIYLMLRDLRLIYIVVVVLLFIAGFLVSKRAEDIFDQKDSPKIVIDEIAALCFVYLFIEPTWLMVLLGFVLFRIFDIFKPFPIKRLQKIPGSLGVMLDDIVAAGYTVVVLLILRNIV